MVWINAISAHEKTILLHKHSCKPYWLSLSHGSNKCAMKNHRYKLTLLKDNTIELQI